MVVCVGRTVRLRPVCPVLHRTTPPVQLVADSTDERPSQRVNELAERVSDGANEKVSVWEFGPAQSPNRHCAQIAVTAEGTMITAPVCPLDQLTVTNEHPVAVKLMGSPEHRSSRLAVRVSALATPTVTVAELVAEQPCVFVTVTL